MPFVELRHLAARRSIDEVLDDVEALCEGLSASPWRPRNWTTSARRGDSPIEQCVIDVEAAAALGVSILDVAKLRVLLSGSAAFVRTGQALGTWSSHVGSVTSNELTELECPGDTDDFAVDEQRLALLVAAAAPTDWRSLSSGERGECWRELREWVAWLRRELVLDHRVVPPCWYRHTALVSVLSALHDRWCHAYDALNPLPGPSDWHHTFQQLEPRLREWSSRTGCTVAVHRPDVVLDYPAVPCGAAVLGLER